MKYSLAVIFTLFFNFLLSENLLIAQTLPIPLALNNRWIYKFPEQNWPFDTVTVAGVKHIGDSTIWIVVSSRGPDFEYIVLGDTIRVKGSDRIYIPSYRVPSFFSPGHIVFHSSDTLHTPYGLFTYCDIYQDSGSGYADNVPYSYFDQEFVVPGVGIVAANSNSCSLDCFGFGKVLVDFSQMTTVSNKIEYVPSKFLLFQNYPNPFNPITNIRFEIPVSSFVSLKIFDVLGREVSILESEQKDAGSYEVPFAGRDLSSGVYFYQMRTGDFVQTRKLLLQK